VCSSDISDLVLVPVLVVGGGVGGGGIGGERLASARVSTFGPLCICASTPPPLVRATRE
jgi:hypothetical protein